MKNKIGEELTLNITAGGLNERALNITVGGLNERVYEIVRIGIIGTGRIVPRFLEEARHVSGLAILCAYNPEKECALVFEKDYRITCFYSDFKEFLGEIDAVYIASPHETHYSYAKTALESGKHVLCEKPLAFTRLQAEELFELAEKNELVLMEGIKTAYCPGFAKMMDAAKSGVIGEIRDVEACFSRITSPELREMTDVAYGGAFLEFGSYTVLPIFKLLGTDYERIIYDSILAENRIDLYTKIHFHYKDGMALSKSGIGVKSEGQLLIAGTKGYILAEAPWWLTSKFEIKYENPNQSDKFTFEFNGDGLRYEINEFISRINGNEGYAYKLTKEETVAMAAVVEQFIEKRKTDRDILLENNRNSGIKIWAHRGCSYRYQENTLPAFKAACDIPGITGIELDIQLTADKEIVVFHDETLDRVTHGTGAIRAHSLSELKRIKFKCSEEDLRETDYSIPTIEEVLRLIKPYCEKKGLLLNIELKNSKVTYEGMEARILKMISEYGLERYVLYSSFNKASLRKLKELDPCISVGIIHRSLNECILIGGNQTVDAYHPSMESLEKNKTLSNNSIVRVWNEKEAFYGQKNTDIIFDLMDLKERGVTDIITNMPEMYLL